MPKDKPEVGDWFEIPPQPAVPRTNWAHIIDIKVDNIIYTLHNEDGSFIQNIQADLADFCSPGSRYQFHGTTTPVW